MKGRCVKGKKIKKFDEYSRVKTAIREEPIKLAQYLRGEKESYEPIKMQKHLVK